ncbi:hypothetical protein DOTSEDRAFT_83736 [Dothistroma septosporum NZE10]|uniref:Mitochondrial fission process protein 1 n=1 Tax=Dothistroma septosporum (strain NZE10 / CBS 128990) TaxID=675120 RepID=N1PC05_DOTSN|nr:hypothetical protein DOTSEDRAFT_83736 [Dothistroma septosporum NZE10]
MKFSSSLLLALMGGACCPGFLLPPLMAQPPMNIVERVAIESCTGSGQSCVQYHVLHLIALSAFVARSKGVRGRDRGYAHPMRANLLAGDLIVLDHLCGDMWRSMLYRITFFEYHIFSCILFNLAHNWTNEASMSRDSKTAADDLTRSKTTNLNNNTGSDADRLDTIPHERKEARPDFSKPLPRQKLPADLQSTLDNEEKFWDVLSTGQGQETTDTSVRYAAYASRLRTIMLSAHRYVAYTSDIGESFRPIAHPWLIRGAYGVSWAYLIGDVSYEGYKARIRNQRVLNPETDEDKAAAAAHPGRGVPAIEDYRAVMAQRAVFQGVASMGLPALTIHSIVRYSGRAMKNVKNVKIRTWGPIGLGLAAVPALPYMFDEPVEHATEWIFNKAFEAVGGPKAVGKDAEGRGAGFDERRELKSVEKEL